MEELEHARSRNSGGQTVKPEHRGAVQSLQSLKLARTEMHRQREATTNEGRRGQLAQALAELDRRMAEVSAVLNP